MLYDGPQVEHLLNRVTPPLQDSFKPFIMLRLAAATEPALDLSQLEACLEVRPLRRIEPDYAFLVFCSFAQVCLEEGSRRVYVEELARDGSNEQAEEGHEEA